MPLSLLVAMAILPAPPAAASLPMYVGGRVARDADGSARFGWPGTYFEARFRGTGVHLATDSPTEHMRLLVDGQEKVVLREAGASNLTLTGLPPGEHVVRLEKMTESQSGGGRLIVLRGSEGSTPLPPIRRNRSVEFIGDSFTVGYGNTSPVRECTEEEVHDRTDTQSAFGPLVAKRFDADYRIHAYSGFGIVRNYNGGSEGLNLPLIYDRTLPGEAASYADDAAWRPQLIVINLGTNDFSTELHAGEKWPDQQSLRSDYRSSYRAFLRRLMKNRPQARFILMGSTSFFGEVEQIASMLTSAEQSKVTTIRFDGLDLMACHSHPSLADHRALATLVATAIERTGLGWTPAAESAAAAEVQLR